MTRRFQADALERFAAGVFEAHGTPAQEAQTVAHLLVQADLMGLPSHGVLRVSQYVEDIRRGAIVPGASVLVRGAAAATVLVDGQWNFGQIGAQRATELAIERAQRFGVGSVSLRRCRHVGRLGAYVEQAAQAGCVALGTCSTSGEGHWVAPFGGREGRLGTNPIAFAAPTLNRPVVMDFSTAALPEGRVRLYRDTGQALPAGILVDRTGAPSTDPADLYESGAILPFGGDQGYKGFGLGFMAQIFSCLLGEPTWREEGLESNANTMWLLAVDAAAWGDAERFRAELDSMIAYVCSSAPARGSNGVLVPGERESAAEARYRREGIPVEEGVWIQLVQVAQEAGVEVET
ncbi:MAG: Ldh family oxidoreductase [Gemmatimonadetes bacterium]|nr:Ldh family oxidoreductase [Gemmatimonadota bacterium]